jgi:hypothetical protein
MRFHEIFRVFCRFVAVKPVVAVISIIVYACGQLHVPWQPYSASKLAV